jgi:6,7-dimethyl-8-ribityllumazine synthase
MRSPSSHSGTIKADPSWRIGIVYSSFYQEIISVMREGAVQELLKSGIQESYITQYEVPGSFEIPLVGRNLAAKKSVDALIALGVVVQGQTHHAELIAEQSARGIMDVQLQYGIPFAMEILFVDDLETARDRTDKGVVAAKTVLHTLTVMSTHSVK